MQYILKLQLMTTLAKMHSEMLNQREKRSTMTKAMNEWRTWPLIAMSVTWINGNQIQQRNDEKHARARARDTIETETYEKAFLLVCRYSCLYVFPLVDSIGRVWISSLQHWIFYIRTQIRYTKFNFWPWHQRNLDLFDLSGAVVLCWFTANDNEPILWTKRGENRHRANHKSRTESKT